MAFLINCIIKDVLLDQIDQKNDCYKISKPHIDERLEQSIQTFGLLNPPVLLENNSTYQTIFGHNRLSILKKLNYSAASAFVLNELKPEEFINHALLKNFRQEIGPLSKIKFIRILRNKFRLSEKDVSSAAKNMQIPKDMIYADLPGRLLSLPEPLKNYLDIKDIGFKVIKNIMRLPSEAVLFLSKWIADINMRVNIFKSIVDYIVDISKRDKSFRALANIDLNSFSDKKRQDESFYHEIFKIRYPDYTQIKSRVDEIVNILCKEGVEIDFPEYFERDEISVILKVNKRDDLGAFKKRINQLDIDAIKNLLDLI